MILLVSGRPSSRTAATRPRRRSAIFFIQFHIFRPRLVCKRYPDVWEFSRRSSIIVRRRIILSIDTPNRRRNKSRIGQKNIIKPNCFWRPRTIIGHICVVREPRNSINQPWPVPRNKHYSTLCAKIFLSPLSKVPPVSGKIVCRVSFYEISYTCVRNAFLIQYKMFGV